MDPFALALCCGTLPIRPFGQSAAWDVFRFRCCRSFMNVTVSTLTGLNRLKVNDMKVKESRCCFE